MPPPNSSMDTAMPQVIPGDILGTPPYATSTPMRTFQMSAHLHHDMQYSKYTLMYKMCQWRLISVDLLEQDSEMQKALQGLDSYDAGTPALRHRHHSTPPWKESTGRSPRPPPLASSSARPLSWSSHSKSHSVNNLPPVVRRGSEDLDTPCAFSSGDPIFNTHYCA